MLKVFVFFIVVSIYFPSAFLYADAESFFGLASASSETRFVDKLSSVLEKRVKAAKNAFLEKLYAELCYVPVWVGRKEPTKFTKLLLEHIERDETIVKSMSLYKECSKLKRDLDNLYSRKSTIQEKVDTEIRTALLYEKYIDYLLYGGIDWKSFDEKKAELAEKYNAQVGWDRYHCGYSPHSLLVDAVTKDDFETIFEKTEPKRFKYAALKRYLLKYLDIYERGGWQKLPKYRKIKPGHSNRAIPLIRKRLALVGDLYECKEGVDMESPVYDKCLQVGIKRFKLRHGLKGDYNIDRETWRELSLPIESLIDKIRLNLDRIKWLYRKQEDVRIELNIPAFRLYFYDGKHLVDTMRVITGKPDHPTPSFHDRMEYLIVNPYWKIPESIVKQEMLKHLIRDPYYYERRGKYLHKTWDEDSPRVDPGSINWARYRSKKKHIPYYFMQLPGTSNALGKIKFLFPNHYSVYIHDTPTKKLFFRNVRAFSHGCMRIQKPREMLKALSLYNDNIDVDELMALLKTRKKKTVVLKHKIPVDIVYLTAFVDDYGNLNFRGDIYGYDKYQLENYKYALIKTEKAKKATCKEDKNSDLQSEKSSKKRVKATKTSAKKKKANRSKKADKVKENDTPPLAKTEKESKENNSSLSVKIDIEEKEDNISSKKMSKVKEDDTPPLAKTEKESKENNSSLSVKIDTTEKENTDKESADNNLSISTKTKKSTEENSSIEGRKEINRKQFFSLKSDIDRGKKRNIQKLYKALGLQELRKK